jgi:hypothetical protein
MRYVNRLNTVVLGQDRIAGLLFRGFQKAFTVILPSKAPEWKWEYGVLSPTQTGLLGQNRGRGMNGRGHLSVPVPRWDSARGWIQRQYRLLRGRIRWLWLVMGVCAGRPPPYVL